MVRVYEKLPMLGRRFGRWTVVSDGMDETVVAARIRRGYVTILRKRYDELLGSAA